MKKIDKHKALEWLKTVQNDLLEKNIDKIMDTYSAQEEVLAINMRLSIKGSDKTMSVASRLGFTEKKVEDFANGTIDLAQDTFKFDGEEDEEEDENSEEAQQGMH